MHLGIDATNIRQGGGVTHLVQLLSAANPEAQGISKITIWCNSNVAEMFPKKLWLSIRTHLFIDTNVIARFIFQHFLLSLQMKKFGCVVAFFPGGTLPLVSTLPAVVMSQNMLPFELDKAKIFGIYSLMFLKICVLRLLQKNSFSKASGIIFLSKYAQQKINDDVKLPVLQALIPHGIEKRFITYPQVQKSIENYSIKKPFRFLYVSILMPYKHQIEVIRAIKLLRARGFPIVCQLVGSTWGWYGAMVLSEIKKLDPENIFIDYRSEVPFDQLHNYYHKSDGFIFASSCENLPNILIEAMASGLPVACSSMGPMPEILGSDGFYFDPRSTLSIEKKLEELIFSVDKRAMCAVNANQKARLYSWQVCANKTFEMLQTIKNEKY